MPGSLPATAINGDVTAVEGEEMLRNDLPIMLWHDLRRL
jgi:hypothetical protein